MYPVCAWAEKLPLCAVIIVRVISFLRKWRLVREVWELSRLYKAITIPADLTGARASASFSTSSSSTTRPAAWTGLWMMPCARGYWTWAVGSWESTRGWATIWPIQHKQVGWLLCMHGPQGNHASQCASYKNPLVHVSECSMHARIVHAFLSDFFFFSWMEAH